MIAKNSKLFSILIVVLLITACQSFEKSSKPESKSRYQLISPGTIIIGSLKFNNPDSWSQQKKQKLVSWTKDGTLLNEIVFGQRTKGQNILGHAENTYGDFNSDPTMSLNLVVEQFTDALTTSNYHNVKLHERSRLDLAGHQAIKFKITYDASTNVNYSAWALFIKRNDKLITIFCSATSRYYFPMLESSYLTILDSMQII